MTDESVDTFYSCLLCQSFAPNHVCIITPERLGLCGAYNWLDGKAAYEIDETGPNQPIQKGECLDPVQGHLEGRQRLRLSPTATRPSSASAAYSIMDRPMTSCGCFEVICAYVPECNGVMVVNREFLGDTPVGMTFSTLAGNVGGGQQTPGFMGCGKVFLTSPQVPLRRRRPQAARSGCPRNSRTCWPKTSRSASSEQGAPDLLDKIADETIATDPQADPRLHGKGRPSGARRCPTWAPSPIRDAKAQAAAPKPATRRRRRTAAADSAGSGTPRRERSGCTRQPPTAASTPRRPSRSMAQIKEMALAEFKRALDAASPEDIVRGIIGTLSRKFLGAAAPPATAPRRPPPRRQPAAPSAPAAAQPSDSDSAAPSARERLSAVTAFTPRKERCEVPICTVKLGALRSEGGTRGRTYRIGGATAMPFHLWEGEMPNRPLVAMEVFDLVSEKYPRVLREIYGDLLQHPAEMAKVCVEKYGADLISVRLEGTHPEKGNRTPEQAVELVKSVLAAVDVPLIVTGHNHYDRNNEVLKAVAAGVRRREPAAQLGRDRTTTAPSPARRWPTATASSSQSPIDVNIAKQLNILLTNMDVKREQIVMDPHDRGDGLRHRIHLFGHGAHPPDRPGRRHDAGRRR